MDSSISYREHNLQQMKRMVNHGQGHHMGSTSMLADGGYGPGKQTYYSN